MLANPISVIFQYDVLNRRIGKTVNGITTTYIYDKSDIIQEINNGVKTNYIRTLGIDEPLSKIDGNGVANHYIHDGLGSTIDIVDDNGYLVSSSAYDAYGNTINNDQFGFTGRENDGTGVMYYRGRFYSPEMERFISRDPKGFAAGDVNLYGYVGQNPANMVDPFGLSCWTSYLATASAFVNTLAYVAFATGQEEAALPLKIAGMALSTTSMLTAEYEYLYTKEMTKEDFAITMSLEMTNMFALGIVFPLGESRAIFGIEKIGEVITNNIFAPVLGPVWSIYSIKDSAESHFEK